MVCEAHVCESLGGLPRSLEGDEMDERLGAGVVNDVLQTMD